MRGKANNQYKNLPTVLDAFQNIPCKSTHREKNNSFFLSILWGADFSMTYFLSVLAMPKQDVSANLISDKDVE